MLAKPFSHGEVAVYAPERLPTWISVVSVLMVIYPMTITSLAVVDCFSGIDTYLHFQHQRHLQQRS